MSVPNTLRIVALIAAFAAGGARADDPAVAAMAEFLAREQALKSLGPTRPPRGPGFGLVDDPPPPAPPGGTPPPAEDPKCDVDRDRDRLPDCVETATGRFVGPHDTGTDPDAPDTDGDKIGDGDEVLGTRQGLDLRALGASPVRRDLFVEVDWVDDAHQCGPHSHRPDPNALARVVASFASAPLANPDGSSGVNLVIDHGQGGAFTGGNRVSIDGILPGTFDATWRDAKTANFDARRLGYFHYAMLVHHYAGGATNSSGYAEIVGDDLIVSLGCQQTMPYLAGTFAHELGHNLGLHHGGFEACNGKPNYNSAMNYRYQFAGADTMCVGTGTAGEVAFSSGQRLPLDERAIDERLGVCGTPAIDWNSDGRHDASLSHDLNASFNGECGSALRKFDDFDDWRHMSFAGILDPSGSLKSIKTQVACAGAPPPLSPAAQGGSGAAARPGWWAARLLRHR